MGMVVWLIPWEGMVLQIFVISREHIPGTLLPRIGYVYVIVLKCFNTSVQTNLMRSNFIEVH